MGPSKRKGSVRRPVLNLNAKDDSPSRPTWQTKYQYVVSNEESQSNGDVFTSSSEKKNPLSGLLGNYNSDSDNEESSVKTNSALDAKVEDFMKEIHSISAELSTQAQKIQSKAQSESSQVENKALYPTSVTAWQQCYDHNSGYPYYWNMETNEVTWEMPPELKAALTTIAIKQQEEQQKQKQSKTNPSKISSEDTKKKVVKYPWQTESDSEDEKIEMITSFGPQSGEESEGENENFDLTNKKSDKNKKSKNNVVSQFLVDPSVSCMDPSKIKSDYNNFAPDDSDGLNETSYETSSLLTHGIQDTGPPGDESFHKNKESSIKKKTKTSLTKRESSSTNSVVENPRSSAGHADTSHKAIADDNSPVFVSSEKTLTDNTEKVSVEIGPPAAYTSIADDVIAQIEMETPPDYEIFQKSEKTARTEEPNEPLCSQPSTKASGIALIANYGDDSDTEDNEKKNKACEDVKSSVKSVFPIEIPQEKDDQRAKPLFPCMDVEGGLKVSTAEVIRPKDSSQEETSDAVSNIYNADSDLSDSASHKAFKRKKRLEFATTIYGPSTSKLPEVAKCSSPERPVSVPSTQYNMDPSLNEHRGFGFSSLRGDGDAERKSFKNYGGIQFVKAETLNPSAAAEPKEKAENETETGSAPERSTKDSMVEQEIEEAATLLREKVTFLTGGNAQIPPIQYMAIELETLALAWQQGALTPQYLLRWLNDKCAELIRHEKSAAPTGWTCLWDRKNKRYYYRNLTTKATQWEYPSAEDKVKGKEGDVVGGGDEMDICDTPPQMSPAESEKTADQQPSTPPPPAITDVSEHALTQSPTPQPPPPPHISFCPESDKPSVKTGKKRKRIPEPDKPEEGTNEETAPAGTPVTYEATGEMDDAAPPLPPLPPPPPPPPDESPPPLPNSPPPLPLDPDQPLPPGVDVPEYTLYRRVSPKLSYKKAQSDTSAYSAELMMYGYGYSSNGQPMTMQMQPIEYHAYMHDSVGNSYLVQSATQQSHVIQCSAKKPKVSLNSEIMSFYSDLAMLDAATNDNSNSESQAASSAVAPSQESGSPATVTAAAPPPPPPPTTTATVTATSVSTATKTAEIVTSNGVNVKRKKKSKSTSGLSLKKKGVSSLVAKWQQVQQEVRKDFSDDDDDVT